MAKGQAVELPFGETYSCRTGKVRFESRTAAKKVLKRLRNKGRTEKTIYECSACSGFHLSSWSREKAREVHYSS